MHFGNSSSSHHFSNIYSSLLQSCLYIVVTSFPNHFYIISPFPSEVASSPVLLASDLQLSPQKRPFFPTETQNNRKPHQIPLAFSKAEILASSEKCCEMKRRNQEDVYEIITLEVQVHYTPGSPRNHHFSFRVVHEFHHFIVRCKHGIVVCRGWFHQQFQGIDTFDCRLEFQG